MMQRTYQITVPQNAVQRPVKPKVMTRVVQPAVQQVVQPLMAVPLAVNPLINRINNLQYGQVLDVSKITADGKGVVTVNAPKTNNGSKVGTANVPIISNNVESYILALRLIYGDQADQQYAEDIAFVNDVLAYRRNISSMMQQVGLPQSPKSPRKRAVPSPNSLADRIRNLKADHVIDVSEMDAEGRNAKTIPTPKTTKTGRFGTDNAPIVSNNIQSYVAALRMIYGPEADRTFALDIDAVNNALLHH